MSQTTVLWQVPTKGEKASSATPLTEVSTPFSFPCFPFDSGEWSIGSVSYRGDLLQRFKIVIAWRNVLSTGKRAPAGTLAIQAWSRPPGEEEYENTLPLDIKGDILGRVPFGYCCYLINPPKDCWPLPPCRIKLTASWKDSATSAPRQEKGLTLHKFSFTSLLTSRHDCCLHFPREQRELWTTRTLLYEIPYFKSLFESGLQESHPVTFEHVTATISSTDSSASVASTLATQESSEFDSDFEDDVPVKIEAARSYSIPVTYASYKAYVAVLVWLQTRTIAFDQLRFGTGGVIPTPPQSATVSTSAIPGIDTVSPRAIYRLAHYLQIDELQAVALREVERQLSKENALYEVFGDMSRQFPAYQKRVIDWIVKNWKEIERAGLADTFEELIDEIVGGGKLTFKILRAFGNDRK